MQLRNHLNSSENFSRKVHALHYANELLVRVRLSIHNLLQTRSTGKKNKKKNVWEKSNDVYLSSIRVQTTKIHIPFVFHHNINVKELFFFSERKLKKALRDTLT